MNPAARFHQRRLDVILDDTDELIIIDDLILGSDEESEDEGERAGGSRPGKKPNINRKRQLYSKLIYSDYFCEDPTYSAQHFRRRFRMRLSLFAEIVDDIVQYDGYFLQRRDCTGLLGFAPIQKCAAAVRLLASGSSADKMDDRYRLAESTMLETLQRFCQAIIAIYGERFLRSPTEEDFQQLLRMHEGKGWPRMLGSIDCSHWSWKNCPKAWAGQYSGNGHIACYSFAHPVIRKIWSYNHCPGSDIRYGRSNLALFFRNDLR